MLVHQFHRQHKHTNLASILRTPVGTDVGFQEQSNPLAKELGVSGQSDQVYTILSLRIVGLGHPVSRGTDAPTSLPSLVAESPVQGSQQQVFDKQNQLGSLEKRNLWGKDQ